MQIFLHTHTHTHTHTNLLNGGKADLTDYGKSLPSLQEIQLQLHALTDNPVNIVVNEDVTVRAKNKKEIHFMINVYAMGSYEPGFYLKYLAEEGMSWYEWTNSSYNKEQEPLVGVKVKFKCFNPSDCVYYTRYNLPVFSPKTFSEVTGDMLIENLCRYDVPNPY